jgi:hypothetical protein
LDKKLTKFGKKDFTETELRITIWTRSESHSGKKEERKAMWLIFFGSVTLKTKRKRVRDNELKSREDNFYHQLKTIRIYSRVQNIKSHVHQVRDQVQI